MKMLARMAFITFFGIGPSFGAAIEPVPFPRVRIEDAFWSPRLRTNGEVTVWHNIGYCERTGRIANFARAGGLEQGKFEGIYFNDSDVYKVLEGASYTLALTKDPKLDAKVDEIIAKIASAQGPDGYLNCYYTLVKPKERWTNLARMHELYCAGHLFEAAVAHYRATGKRTLLEVACRFADLIDRLFRVEGKPGVPGHEEIELALVKLARVTGEERYLKLANHFIDERGVARGRKSFGEYCQDHIPVREQSDIVGHAVRAMYLWSGAADIARLTGDGALEAALERVWRNVALKKMYVTGGIGPSARNEGFTVDYDLPNDTAYAETCASIGMALWNHRLFLLRGEARFMDTFERVLFNGLLSGVSLSGDRFFYVNPLASRGRHHRQPWYGCACCPTNVVRFIPSIGGYIYARSEDGIWVNLYVAGTAKIPIGAGEVQIRQATRYPWEGAVRIRVTPPEPATFAVRVRIPGWCRGAAARLNGKPVEPMRPERGYLVLRRRWEPGDEIALDLPMPIERIEAHPRVAADRGRVALRRGPILYCLEGVDHGGHARRIALPREARLEARFEPDLLGGVVVIRGEGVVADAAGWKGKLYRAARPLRRVPIRAIPYHAWDNREPGEMVVWIPESLALAERPPIPTIATRARAKASHCGGKDTVEALHDGLLPKNSNDRAIPRFTWWDHRGTEEWVAYTFAAPVSLNWAEVYWYDDRGGCRLPASWTLQYRDAKGAWRPVEPTSGYPVQVDRFCRVTFKPVEAAGLRIAARLRPNASAGILEWRLPEE